MRRERLAWRARMRACTHSFFIILSSVLSSLCVVQGGGSFHFYSIEHFFPSDRLRIQVEFNHCVGVKMRTSSWSTNRPVLKSIWNAVGRLAQVSVPLG